MKHFVEVKTFLDKDVTYIVNVGQKHIAQKIKSFSSNV